VCTVHRDGYENQEPHCEQKRRKRAGEGRLLRLIIVVIVTLFRRLGGKETLLLPIQTRTAAAIRDSALAVSLIKRINGHFPPLPTLIGCPETQENHTAT
jgi:hypothetical protein